MYWKLWSISVFSKRYTAMCIYSRNSISILVFTVMLLQETEKKVLINKIKENDVIEFSAGEIL